MLGKISYIFDKKQKIALIGLFFLILGGTVLELLGVTAILPLVNVVMMPEMIEENKYMYFIKNLFNIGSVKGFILFLALSLVVVYVVKNIYLTIMNDVIIKFTNDCQNEYSTRLIDVYLHQDYLFHVKTNTAELQRNVNVDVQQFIQLVTACLRFVIEMSVCVVLVIFLLQQDVVTTVAVAVTLSAVILIIYVGFRGKLIRLGELSRNVGARGTKIGLQIFGGIKEIKVLNREDYFVKIFRENAVEFSSIHRKQQLLSYIPKPLIESLCICGLLLTLSFKIYYGSDGDIQKFVPTLSVFAIAAFRMLPSFNRITGYLSSIMFTKPSLDAFYEDLKQAEELVSKGKYDSDQVEKLEFEKAIDIRELSFTYPNTDKVIIDDVS
ncbi:MAG: ABC transporter ATP-binding protein, partial [Lachnospiraceae bacterium]|nr:ABC transporter ATP-binding protein [Lachnospiraceae bacterium]